MRKLLMKKCLHLPRYRISRPIVTLCAGSSYKRENRSNNSKCTFCPYIGGCVLKNTFLMPLLYGSPHSAPFGAAFRASERNRTGACYRSQPPLRYPFFEQRVVVHFISSHNGTVLVWDIKTCFSSVISGSCRFCRITSWSDGAELYVH